MPHKTLRQTAPSAKSVPFMFLPSYRLERSGFIFLQMKENHSRPSVLVAAASCRTILSLPKQIIRLVLKKVGNVPFGMNTVPGLVRSHDIATHEQYSNGNDDKNEIFKLKSMPFEFRLKIFQFSNCPVAKQLQKMQWINIDLDGLLSDKSGTKS